MDSLFGACVLSKIVKNTKHREARQAFGGSSERPGAPTRCTARLFLNPLHSTNLRYCPPIQLAWSMSFRSLLRLLLRVLIPFVICSTTYLYLYPVFNGCAFPSTDKSPLTAFVDTLRQHAGGYKSNLRKPESVAPFRLLVLADPQLEGDSSLPKPEDGLLPRLQRRWTHLTRPEPTFDDPPTTWRVELYKVLFNDIPRTFQALRKRLDLFGNDYYLAHIYRTLHWWTSPTHITVLGDLTGSQWVDDEEFDWRGWRFWNRVMRHGVKVPDDWTERRYGDRMAKLGDPAWRRRVINIAGNHDIGYAGEISRSRMDRFERVFGKADWDVRFEYAAGQSNPLSNGNQYAPTLHLVVLNTMNLDTPAFDEDLQRESYEYLNTIMNKRSRPVEDRSSFTLLLTHIPLHKEAGVCVDAPFFDFWGDDDGGGVYRPNGVKEQNHLSYHASRQGILEGIFGMSGHEYAPENGRGRHGLILTGHDHEGCDVWHYVPENQTMRDADDKGPAGSNWQAVKWRDADFASSHAGVREVTLRSMMGDFGGNAGLLSAWFDFQQGEWKYEIRMCKAGVQHLWWAVHVIDLITVIALTTLLIADTKEKAETPSPKDETAISLVQGPTSKQEQPAAAKKGNKESANLKSGKPGVKGRQGASHENSELTRRTASVVKDKPNR
jgi:hypothetical protein